MVSSSSSRSSDRSASSAKLTILSLALAPVLNRSVFIVSQCLLCRLLSVFRGSCTCFYPSRSIATPYRKDRPNTRSKRKRPGKVLRNHCVLRRRSNFKVFWVMLLEWGYIYGLSDLGAFFFIILFVYIIMRCLVRRNYGYCYEYLIPNANVDETVFLFSLQN